MTTVTSIIDNMQQTYPFVDIDITDSSITIFDENQYFGSASKASSGKWSISCINKKHIYDVLCENRFEYQNKVTALYNSAGAALTELVVLYSNRNLVWK